MTSAGRQWERNTSDNVNRTSTTHVITSPGVHTLKFWMVDPTVVLQNLSRGHGRRRHQLPGAAGEPPARPLTGVSALRPAGPQGAVWWQLILAAAILVLVRTVGMFELTFLTTGPGLGVDIDEGLAARYPYRRAYLPVNRLTDGTLHDW